MVMVVVVAVGTILVSFVFVFSEAFSCLLSEFFFFQKKYPAVVAQERVQSELSTTYYRSVYL